MVWVLLHIFEDARDLILLVEYEWPYRRTRSGDSLEGERHARTSRVGLDAISLDTIAGLTI